MFWIREFTVVTAWLQHVTPRFKVFIIIFLNLFSNGLHSSFFLEEKVVLEHFPDKMHILCITLMPYAKSSNCLISISDLYNLWKLVKDIKILLFAISFVTNTWCQCCGKAGSKDTYCTGMYIRRYKLPTESMKKTRPVKK